MKTAERSAIQGLALTGLSTSEIARRTGRSRQTIARVLSSEEFEHARSVAKSALAEGAADFALDWRKSSREAAKRGRHEPARDALIAIKAIEAPNQRIGEANAGFTVQIGVVLPGLGLPPRDEPITVSLQPIVEGDVGDDPSNP